MANKDRPCDALDRVLSAASSRLITEFCAPEVSQIGTQVSAPMTLTMGKFSSPVQDIAECISIPSGIVRAADLKPGERVARDFSCTPEDKKAPAQQFTVERSCAKDAKPEICERVKPVVKPLKPK